MNGFALGIVLAAAFLHAGWNYLTKKSRKKIVFIWWFLLVALILFFPMFIYFWPQTNISMAGWNCIIATGILHGLYYWFLGEAYERGDLSLVYPLARGSAPLFVPILAVGIIHEQLTLLGSLGIALVIVGILIIYLKSFSLQSFLEPFLALGGGASIWALLAGGTITGYSLIDKVGVSIVFPPVYVYLMLVGTWVLISFPVLGKEHRELKQEWKRNKRPILLVGFLDIFTYLMILFALRISQVSYVVAVREVSIVFSALFGIVLLGERHAIQKMVGAVLIASGVVVIGLGG